MSTINKPVMTRGERKIFEAKVLLADYCHTKSRRDKLTKKVAHQKEAILKTLGEIPQEEINERIEAQINHVIIQL